VVSNIITASVAMYMESLGAVVTNSSPSPCVTIKSLGCRKPRDWIQMEILRHSLRGRSRDSDRGNALVYVLLYWEIYRVFSAQAD
jgi:hypothetical protein